MTTSAATITTPSDLEIAVTRAFSAPATLVFAAFTEPALIQRWQYGPDGWSMPVCEVDAREGGSYRFEWAHTDGRRMGSHGTFLEFAPGERLVFTETFDEAWYPGECVVTVTFAESAGVTTVTMTMRYESVEAREMALSSHAADGVAAGFERLDAILADSAR